jgi:hypothetical protein
VNENRSQVILVYTRAIFLWQDDPNKKPTEVPAPTYISLLFKWVTDKISDETLVLHFPFSLFCFAYSLFGTVCH